MWKIDRAESCDKEPCDHFVIESKKWPGHFLTKTGECDSCIGTRKGNLGKSGGAEWIITPLFNSPDVKWETIKAYDNTLGTTDIFRYDSFYVGVVDTSVTTFSADAEATVEAGAASFGAETGFDQE